MDNSYRAAVKLAYLIMDEDHGEIGEALQIVNRWVCRRHLKLWVDNCAHTYSATFLYRVLYHEMLTSEKFARSRRAVGDQSEETLRRINKIMAHVWDNMHGVPMCCFFTDEWWNDKLLQIKQEKS